MVALAVATCVARPGPAGAADTWEEWEPGATDAELYVGYSGIGLAGRDRGPSLEYLQGFGLGHTLSTFLSATVEAADRTRAGFAAALFGTPLDTDHVDLDLILIFGQAWRRLDDLSAGAAFELNLDLAPDLSRAGLYLRGCVHVTGDRCALVETILGAYVTLAQNHQLLLEADATFTVTAAPADATEVGGIALGYNVMVHDAVELITQLFLDVPQAGERFSSALTVGVILTLPSTGEGLHM
jgi:hypothetical protein